MTVYGLCLKFAIEQLSGSATRPWANPDCKAGSVKFVKHQCGNCPSRKYKSEDFHWFLCENEQYSLHAMAI